MIDISVLDNPLGTDALFALPCSLMPMIGSDAQTMHVRYEYVKDQGPMSSASRTRPPRVRYQVQDCRSMVRTSCEFTGVSTYFV